MSIVIPGIGPTSFIQMTSDFSDVTTNNTFVDRINFFLKLKKILLLNWNGIGLGSIFLSIFDLLSPMYVYARIGKGQIINFFED